MKKLLTIIALSVVAFANAAYLVYKRYCLQALTASAGFCDINSTFSCSNVLSHPAAMLRGVPFPAIALVVYPIIAIIARCGYKKYITRHWIVLACMGIGGLCFNGYFIYQEATVIKAFCILCLLCTIIIAMIAVLSLIGIYESKKQYTSS